MLLRCNASATASSRPASGAAMRFSSSVRVSRTSDWKPGRSTGTPVAVSAERRSLASLLSSRRRASDPTAAVPAGSALLASAIDGDDVIEHGLVDLVAGKVCVPYSFADGREVRARVGERDAGSAAAQVDERDDTAGGQSGRHRQRGERRDRVRYERGGHAVGREAGDCHAALRAGRRSPPGPSAREPRWRRVRHRPPCGSWRRGPRRAPVRRGGSCRPRRLAGPGLRHVRRSRSSTTPGWFRAGFSAGTPTSGARPGNSVNTARRITGGRPTRAATRFVIPMDNPRESLMHTPCVRPPITIAAKRPGNMRIPLVPQNP